MPLAAVAAPLGADGSKVAKFTQSELMSSSMARTAPARTSKLARSVMFSPGPPTYTRAPSRVHPDPRAGDVYLIPKGVTPLRRIDDVEAGNRPSVVDEEIEVLPHSYHP